MMLRAFQRDAVGLFLLNIKNPKAEETLMCFCKSQQIKKMCVQNSSGSLGLAFMRE